MFCVKSPFTVEDSIKKSRFIGVIMPCHDENEVVLKLKQLYVEYADATHIAYAYRIKTGTGLTYRFNDAGEPTGTAGKPIYQHLEGKELINSLIAVIRYFGGVKLGAGGLTRAYGNTARQAIDAAELIVYTEWVKVRLTLDYNKMQVLEYILKKLDGQITHKEFSEQVHLVVQVPSGQLATLLDSIPGHVVSLPDQRNI
jgi:uncharacterized YigZ family protein